MNDKLNKKNKNVFCILHGLIRTAENALPIFLERVVENNANYNFTFVIHTQEIQTNIENFFYKKLNNLKNVYIKKIYNSIIDKNLCKNSNDAYYFRLYDCLVEEEQHNKLIDYDIYMNCRLDAIPNASVPLEMFLDCFCIICGDVIRPCVFHHRDWDYFTLGNSKMYKLFHYPIINLLLQQKGLNWIHLVDHNNPQWGESGWATSVNGVAPNSKMSEEEKLCLEKNTGLKGSGSIIEYNNVIRNLQSKEMHRGKFWVSDAYTQIYASLLRQPGHTTASYG